MLDQRERVLRELRAIPRRMQRTTNQSSLVLELLEDFRADRYREISWFGVAVASSALLYCVSPADVIPDTLPLVGAMDDAVVLSVALRIIRSDLERYIHFKGYDPDDYFGTVR